MDPDFSFLPESLKKLDEFIAERESAYSLKPGAEANIVWANEENPQKTEYAIVYLHGFRASHPEGYPVHKTIAESFSYNLFLNRMDEHGIQSDYPLLDLTEQKLLQSAWFAFEIGNRIGKKVILMGTSTGGSLALYLASQPDLKQYINSLVLYSPLIKFYGLKSKLLTSPYGRRLLRVVPGKKYLIENTDTTYAEDRIWNKKYALAGALALGKFIQQYMTNETFHKVTHPTFIGYYYKNKDEQDTVVSVPAIKKMSQNLGTRTELIVSANFPEAKNHVICNSLLSKSVQNVNDHTTEFLKNVVAHETRTNM